MLESAEETRWRVTEDDWKHNRDYDEWLKAFEEMIQKTDTDFGSWTIIEATDREYAKAKILSKVVEIFTHGFPRRSGKRRQRLFRRKYLRRKKHRRYLAPRCWMRWICQGLCQKPFIRKS